jgi:hypothetical protein
MTMDSRPRLSSDGVEYVRVRGSWVDTRFVSVSKVLAGRLDLAASADPSLWPRCLAQDLSDGVGHQATKRSRAGGGKTRTRPSRNPALRCKFDDSRSLWIYSDLTKNWKQRPQTWGCVDQTTLPALNGHSLRIQIAFLSTYPHEAPNVELSSGIQDGVAYVLEGTTMALKVGLFDEAALFNETLKWRETRNGKPLVFRDQWPTEFWMAPGKTGAFRPWYSLKFWLIVQPPVPKPAPIYYEWSKRFFPGGLPSLGKRHS